MALRPCTGHVPSGQHLLFVQWGPRGLAGAPLLPWWLPAPASRCCFLGPGVDFETLTGASREKDSLSGTSRPQFGSPRAERHKARGRAS